MVVDADLQVSAGPHSQMLDLLFSAKLSIPAPRHYRPWFGLQPPLYKTRITNSERTLRKSFKIT